MKIELTKEQYKNLIITNAIGNAVFGILGDSLEDTDYKTRSNTMDKLEDYLLSFAKEFDLNDLTEEFNNKTVLNEEYYEEKIQPILTDFEEVSLFDDLSNELAKRDFRRDHSRAEIREMTKENGGYFGVEMYDYEKKYWDEFEKYGYDRLEIVKESAIK
ncbi:MAG: hypothetical protein WCO23_00910 [bacterium]